MKRLKTGGGWHAVRYALDLAQRVGWRRLLGALRSRNACKTCALGMGGQKGGMRNEVGHWPEVCKKSLQAMAADMQDGLRPEFFRRYSITDLQSLSPRDLEAAGRIGYPMIAGPGDTHYRLIEWEDAFKRISTKLRAIDPLESFFYVSGRCSNEAGFLLQLFARLYGTNHVNNCSYYCHQASGVGLSGAIGSGTATVVLDDVEQADLLFLIGGNPASNHPRLMRTLMNIRRRGGRVVVINPVRETGLVNFSVPSDLRSLLFGSEIASDYLQPHIGGDIALLTGIAKALLLSGHTDRAFIERATEGWAEFEELVESTSWSTIEKAGGISRDQIEQIAEIYAAAKNVVFSWTMGITHHAHGVNNVQMIVNLALMRGMVGRPHAGLMPIRGHSNVQGIGSVGVTPQLKSAFLKNLSDHFEIELPNEPGHDTMACMEAADQGKMRFGWCLGGNLFGSNPDSTFAARALGKLDTLVYLSTTLNTGHARGLARETIVLPVLARDEESQATTQESMFNYVRLSDGGPPRLAGPRSEVSVISELARHLLPQSPVDWEALADHETIRKAIAAVVPGFKRIGEIDRTREEFQIDGRTFHTPVFPTASGKARFHAHPIPDSGLAADSLKLMTIRSEGQFNTVVYEEEDLYRGQERRDVILMHPGDIERFELEVDGLVTVTSSVGTMKNIRVRVFDVRAGNALMYFPEANVLVPRTVDGRSKTPAFKSIEIRLKRQSAFEPESRGRVALTVSASSTPRKLNAC